MVTSASQLSLGLLDSGMRVYPKLKFVGRRPAAKSRKNQYGKTFWKFMTRKVCTSVRTLRNLLHKADNLDENPYHESATQDSWTQLIA